MEIIPYFEKIEDVVIADLKAAKKEILLAVAWFTNKKIFEVLIDKLNNDKNVVVKLIVINDNINNRINGLDFQHFISSGGIFYFAEKNIPMHSKYVVVDSNTVITGSYNYTYLAESTNEENVIRFSGGGDIVQLYIDNFNKIVSNKKPIVNVKEYLEVFPPCADLFSYSNYAVKDIYQEAESLRRLGNADEAEKLISSIPIIADKEKPKDFVINNVIYEQWKETYYVDKVEVKSNRIVVKFRTPITDGCILCSPNTQSAWFLCLSSNKEEKINCYNVRNVCVNDSVLLKQLRKGYVYFFYINNEKTDFSNNACGYKVNDSKQMIDANGNIVPVKQIKISPNDILTCEVCFKTENWEFINGVIDFVEGNGFEKDNGHWNAFKINMALNRE
jgi:hypothetical protein